MRLRETNRPWAVEVKRTQTELRRWPFGKIQINARNKKRRVLLTEANILEIETNSLFRKRKEESYMSYLQNPISRPSTEISPI
jgi:hypothetical protein